LKESFSSSEDFIMEPFYERIFSEIGEIGIQKEEKSLKLDIFMEKKN